jgi:hypothetical protein
MKIPEEEKKMGDEARTEKNYIKAISHYKNALVALRIIFNEEGLSEDQATKVIEDVGVSIFFIKN